MLLLVEVGLRHRHPDEAMLGSRELFRTEQGFGVGPGKRRAGTDLAGGVDERVVARGVLVRRAQNVADVAIAAPGGSVLAAHAGWQAVDQRWQLLFNLSDPGHNCLKIFTPRLKFQCRRQLSRREGRRPQQPLRAGVVAMSPDEVRPIFRGFEHFL